MTTHPSSTTLPNPREMYRQERLSARENLTTPMQRFEGNPFYREARAELTAKLERLVDEGRIARTEADDLDELAFGMANSAAGCVAERWYDTVTRALLPDVAVTDDVRKRGDRFAALEPVLEGPQPLRRVRTQHRARPRPAPRPRPAVRERLLPGRAALARDHRLPGLRPRARGNGMAEWFIERLKEQVLWCERFATVAEANAAVREFCRRFRDEWIVERLDYRTPVEAYTAFIASQAA